MKFYSLNIIVRNVLLRRRYPLQYYLEFLVSGRDCLRQMSLDSLGVINTVLLDVTLDGGYNVATLPSDYSDWTKVGIRAGQFVKPLLERSSINNLHNYDDNGAIIAYGGTTDIPQSAVDIDMGIGLNSGTFAWDTVTWDNYGEFLGRYYGFSGAGSQSDTFKVIPERNQIQLDENLIVDKIVLEYIGDGMCSDAATQIPVYAVDVIEAYILWQMKEQNRNYGLGERQIAYDEYVRQYKIFLARKNPLTKEMITRILNKNYRGSIKT